MDFELKRAKEKWEQEQRQRKEQARARIEREKKAKEEAAKQREALEAHQRQRRIQEEEAAESARMQEEESFFLGDGVRFCKVLNATLASGEGDKIQLPSSAFEELSSQGALDKGPMFFEIKAVSKSPANNNSHMDVSDDEEAKKTHAGVLQFTATEGCVELPSHVWQNCGLAETPLAGGQPLVRVQYLRLPKGTYAKLEPQSTDFIDVPNHKAVLETKLRQHATLSKGDLLTVQYGGMDYGLLVVQLKPSSAVTVLETDIEVDITEPVNAMNTRSQNRLVPLILGKSYGDFVEEGQYKYYKFTIDPKIADAIAQKLSDVIVHLVVEDGGDGSDADLYVSQHPLLFPSQHQHQWASHDIGTKLVCLNSSSKALNAGSYTVAVYGFKGRSGFKITVDMRPSVQNEVSGQRVGTASMEMGFSQCVNCKQVVPLRSIALHEAYCRRHNVLCPYPSCGVVLRREEMGKHTHCTKCGQAFQQEEINKHMKVFHEPQQCRCGVLLEREEMVEHQNTVCPLRMITCRFCGDLVQAGGDPEDRRDIMQGLSRHESSCGARTSPCDLCSRAVMLKEMDLHMAASHGASSTVFGVSNPQIPLQDVPETACFSAESVEEDLTQNARQHNVPHRVVDCPICGIQLEGNNVEEQLNAHLDGEHFSSNSPTSPMETEVPTGVSVSTRKPLLVSCPICGLAVHSERDLSSHIDMVH